MGLIREFDLDFVITSERELAAPMGCSGPRRLRVRKSQPARHRRRPMGGWLRPAGLYRRDASRRATMPSGSTRTGGRAAPLSRRFRPARIAYRQPSHARTRCGAMAVVEQHQPWCQTSAEASNAARGFRRAGRRCPRIGVSGPFLAQIGQCAFRLLHASGGASSFFGAEPQPSSGLFDGHCGSLYRVAARRRLLLA